MDYKCLEVDELVALYQNGDRRVLNELVFRFRLHSKKEAGSLLKIYRDITTAEYEDLVQIGLTCLITALETYSFKGSFFAYWAKIARHEMLEHIQQFTLSYTQVFQDREEGDIEVGEMMLASSDESNTKISNSLLVEQIKWILANPKKYDIPEDEALYTELFYLVGISYEEISRMSALPYFTIRSKIQRTREKIVVILNNSKE